MTRQVKPGGEDDAIALGQTLPGAGAAEPERAEGPARARGDAIGRFVVLETLGQGGMGVVLSAYDPELDRRVAIKLLRPRGKQEAEAAKARLQREAQAMARLRHPNVVTVYDVGTSGDRVFVAMELVEQGTLRAELERLRVRTPLPWRRILELFIRAGRGLAAAHGAGLVHRDFKPDNVLVGEDGRVQVTDFGLVGTASEPSEEGEGPGVSPDTPLAARLTEDGAVLGTPVYMAPEQHEGLPTDARSDQFSFCASLYEALYGQLPFAGANRRDYVEAARAGEVRPPPEASPVPDWVRRVLRRGLSADPDRRYASMDDLLAELDIDPVRDRQVGQRTRTFLGFVLGLLFTFGPFGFETCERLFPGRPYLGLFAGGGSVLLVILALGLWARETLSRTAYNRHIGRAVVLVFVAELVLIAGGGLLGIAPHKLQVTFILLWFAVAGVVTLTIEWRMWPLTVGYLAAFLSAAARPDLVYEMMSSANAVAMLNAVWVWWPWRRVRSAPS